MSGPTTNRSFAGGHFELTLEGSRPAYVKSFDGGGVETSIVKGVSSVAMNKAFNQGPRAIKELMFEVGMASAGPILTWLRSTLHEKHTQQNGSVTHADFNLYSRASYEFFDAWLTEVTFPACGADSKEMYLKAKLQPEGYDFDIKDSGQRISSDMPTKQKLWSNLGFRLTLDGYEDCTKYVNRIEPFTIKQAVAKLEVGERIFPQYEPCQLEIGQLTCTLSEAHAKPLSDWHDEYVATQNKGDQPAQLTGSLEFLSPGRDETLFEIQLFEVGSASFGSDMSKANFDQIKRVKSVFTIGRIELSGKGLGIA